MFPEVLEFYFSCVTKFPFFDLPGIEIEIFVH